MNVAKGKSSVSQRGFTLLEIMVVVVIIGLLAAIVAPKLLGNIDTARTNRARQDIRNIDTDQGLQALVTNPGAAVAPNWKPGGYLRSIPRDPWNNPYHYRYPGQHGDFDVWTYGADGQQGGEGTDADIGNWNIE